MMMKIVKGLNAMRTIIIDTDPGIDDAMAIQLAFAHPELEVIGLTSIFGNVDIERATRNALRLAEMARHSAVVARGAEVPLFQSPKPAADFVHGREGFGREDPATPTRNADPRSAAQFIVDTISDRPGEVTVCAVGPLTNIALALDIDSTIASKIERLVIMGGAVDTTGNVTEWAEANIWQDPHAAERVFSASWPMTLVGLDVTEKIHCSQTDFRSVAQSSPEIGGFLERAASFYIEFHRKSAGVDACYLHDPSAILYLTDPQLFTIEAAPLRAVTEGDRVGQTVRAIDSGRATVDVCVSADVDGVRDRFLAVLSTIDTKAAERDSDRR